MGKLTIPAMVEGGKAGSGPPLGPALGAAKVNISAVLAAINDKTKAFAGMQVPVKVVVDTDSKEFEIEVGTPSVATLLKHELGLKEPVKEEAGVKGKKAIGNISIEQAVKIARMKESGMLSKTLKASVKQVVGTCKSMGITVEGKDPKEVLKEIVEGRHDDKIK